MCYKCTVNKLMIYSPFLQYSMTNINRSEIIFPVSGTVSGHVNVKYQAKPAHSCRRGRWNLVWCRV